MCHIRSKAIEQRVIAIITRVTQTLAHGILVGNLISDTHSLEMEFPKGGSAAQSLKSLLEIYLKCQSHVEYKGTDNFYASN